MKWIGKLCVVWIVGFLFLSCISCSSSHEPVTPGAKIPGDVPAVEAGGHDDNQAYNAYLGYLRSRPELAPAVFVLLGKHLHRALTGWRRLKVLERTNGERPFLSTRSYEYWQCAPKMSTI